jgi:hypothetical protein
MNAPVLRHAGWSPSSRLHHPPGPACGSWWPVTFDLYPLEDLVKVAGTLRVPSALVETSDVTAFQRIGDPDGGLGPGLQGRRRLPRRSSEKQPILTREARTLSCLQMLRPIAKLVEFFYRARGQLVELDLAPYRKLLARINKLDFKSELDDHLIGRSTSLMSRARRGTDGNKPSSARRPELAAGGGRFAAGRPES